MDNQRALLSYSKSNLSTRDSVDRVLAGWARQFPELDTRPLAVTHRITAISTELNQVAEAVFGDLGVTGPVFDVLAALYAAGRPYRLNPSALSQGRVMSSGGMTARLDLAERAGWLARSRDPHDRRGVTVRLSERGVRLVRRGVSALLAEQSHLTQVLDRTGRGTVDRLLDTLVRGDAGSAHTAGLSLDSMTAFWNRDFPDHDPWLIRFLSAIPVLSARIERESGKVVKIFGITPNGFGLLCALRRAGAPFRLTPSDLYRLVILSPAGVTAQLDRMQRAGLVSRTARSQDRRVLPVTLTSFGRELVEHTIADFIASHRQVLQPLSSSKRQGLARSLHQILLSLEQTREGSQVRSE